MKHTFISLVVALLVAVLVYLALPSKMYVEKALNIIVLSFIGTAVLTALVLKLRGRRR
jgi:multisubunit Na+/H+ antiporter MnhF subunit